MQKIKIIRLDMTDSTNNFLRNYQGEEGELMTVVATRFQTAGKGQGSNTWESERDQNITMSIKLRPYRLHVNRQYVLQEAMALAIRDTIAKYGVEATIKWPNDIYVGDKKICGTLSECSFSGKYIDDCILGSGININQELFLSDAPNPISLKQATGITYDIDEVMATIIESLVKYLDMIDLGDYDSLHTQYLAHLYRRKGFYPYTDENGSFTARIVNVEPNGHLVLERKDGSRHSYAFKEVSAII